MGKTARRAVSLARGSAAIDRDGFPAGMTEPRTQSDRGAIVLVSRSLQLANCRLREELTQERNRRPPGRGRGRGRGRGAGDRGRGGMSQSPEAGEEVSRTEAAHSHARRFLPRPQFAARPRSGPRLGPPGRTLPSPTHSVLPRGFLGSTRTAPVPRLPPAAPLPCPGPAAGSVPGTRRAGPGAERDRCGTPPHHPPTPARGGVGRETQISESSAREGREGAERDAKIHQECGGQLQLHRVWRVRRDSEPRMWTERDLAHRECNMDGRRAVAGRRQRPVTILGLFTKVNVVAVLLVPGV